MTENKAVPDVVDSEIELQPTRNSATEGQDPPKRIAKERPVVADERKDDEVVRPPASPPKKVIKTARDLMLEEVAPRAERAEGLLKTQLTGSLAVEVLANKGRFLIEGTAEAIKVTSISELPPLKKGDDPGSLGVDCVVKLSEAHLFQVRSGDLNPQLAMLSNKIRVEGRMGLAVYLFNLISPRERSRG